MTLDIERLRADTVLSPLDYRFAQAMGRISGETRPDVLAAIALVSKQVRDGHVCLDLGRISEMAFLLDEDGHAVEVAGWPPLETWIEQLQSSALIGEPGNAEPLVLDRARRLYLRRFWHDERVLAEAILNKAADEPIDIDERVIAQGLHRLYLPETDAEGSLQRAAAETAVRRRLCVITGGPGTGKTSTVVKVLALLLEQAQALSWPSPRITLLAPTGKAAARLVETIRRAKSALDCPASLKEQIPEDASTIHRCLVSAARATRDRDSVAERLETDVVVVDEASMVDLELMAHLFSILPETTRVILLGDPDQLSSVEAGAVLGDICQAVIPRAGGPRVSALTRCIVTLTHSYRHTTDSGIRALADVIKAGEGSEALAILDSNRYPDLRLVEPSAGVAFRASMREVVLNGYARFIRAEEIAEKLDTLNHFRVLCAHRKGPLGTERVNDWIANILCQGESEAGQLSARVGEPITVTRNDYRLELYNGDIGLLLPDISQPESPRAFFIAPEGTYRSYSPWELPCYEKAFAMSIHKSQGSEFDHVAVVLPVQLSPVLTRELLYTAVTRARRSVTIFASASVVKQTIARRVFRASGLRDLLSVGLEYRCNLRDE